MGLFDTSITRQERSCYGWLKTANQSKESKLGEVSKDSAMAFSMVLQNTSVELELSSIPRLVSTTAITNSISRQTGMKSDFMAQNWDLLLLHNLDTWDSFYRFWGKSNVRIWYPLSKHEVRDHLITIPPNFTPHLTFAIFSKSLFGRQQMTMESAWWMFKEL